MAAAVAGCGSDKVHHLDGDANPAMALTIEPADDMVTITDGVAVMKPYTVHAMVNGQDTDVTDQAVLSIPSNYGSFAGANATISGMGAGPTQITATLGAESGSTTLTVFVKKHVVDPSAPANAPGLFDGATENPALAPTILYPSPQILVPPNLGSFDVHWNRDAGAVTDLFEVKLTNQYVDVRLYTPGLDPSQPYWSQFAPDSWYPIASSRQQLTLTVAGMATANPTTKGTAASQTVDVTNEDSKGGIYYWTTTTQSIMRYDIEKPDVPPSPYFTTSPSSCMGCHTLSRDGTKLAVTIDGATGRGTVWDVASQAPAYDINGTPPNFDFAAFNAAATKVLTIDGGHMHLRALDSTLLVPDEIPPLQPGYMTTTPEVSPDGTKVVEVEYASGEDYYEYDGSIVVRSYDDATNTFGTPTMLVPSTSGVQNYYPSWSPDGQWIVFTRTDGLSYNNASAEIWVIKADGTGQPIQLLTADAVPALANVTNSWARWVPFGQTFGPSSEPIFYLTFSSSRAYGVRIPGGGRPQIWMTPFFPDRAAAGMDPTGAAFRVPFQDVATSNHIAQWTEAIIPVIGKTK